MARIAGMETQAIVFEPKDGMRYGHKLWADVNSGLLLKAQLLRRAQHADRAIRVHRHRDRRQDRARHGAADVPARRPRVGRRAYRCPATWCSRTPAGLVKELPPGFSKIVEGYRTLRGKVGPVAHLVYSDGLVAVSVFVEPMPQAPQPIGSSQQGGINVYSRQLDEHLVTVLGETPGATVRQIAYSVAHR